MIEISFIAPPSLIDVAKAVGIPTAPSGTVYQPCPFAVGDFISFPAASGLAFRVTWRLYSESSDSKPAAWLLGLEKADHPLAGQTQT